MLLAGRAVPASDSLEVIRLVDSATGFQGRSVWTDEHGDQRTPGEAPARNHITARSFRHACAGVTGSYDFSWQVMDGERASWARG
jgi:hypothetical protein